MTTTSPSTPALGRAAAATRLSARGRVARVVTRQVARRVPVLVQMPDGTPLAVPSSPDRAGVGGSDVRPPVLLIREPDAFFERLGREPKLGIGEGYVAGEWSPGPGTDLADVLTPFAARLTTLLPARL